MASLGTFGAALRELDPNREKDTFVFGEVEFEVVGDIPAILMLQLGAAAGSGVEDAEGMAACWEALRRSVGDRFDELRTLALNRETDLEELMKLVFALYQRSGGRPTVQASGSPAGASTTTPNLSTSSTHPALAHLVPVKDVLTG